MNFFISACFFAAGIYFKEPLLFVTSGIFMVAYRISILGSSIESKKGGPKND